MKFLCTVYDKKGEFYSAPFTSASLSSAVRDFEGAIRSGAGALGQFPSDFDLYHCGNFDDESGLVDTMTPVFIVNGGSFRE